MKLYAGFAVLLACLSTLSGTEAQITDQIVAAVDDLSQTIQNLGLDPLHIKREIASYALPVPVIFNAVGFMEDIRSTGMSNIVINHIEYNILNFQLIFDVEMPHVHVSAGQVTGEATIFGNNIFGEGSGSLDVRNVQVKGVAHVGVLGGISIRELEIDSRIGAIESNINLSILGFDISDTVNSIVGESLLNLLEAFKDEIDELISIVVRDYINDNILP